MDKLNHSGDNVIALIKLLGVFAANHILLTRAEQHIDLSMHTNYNVTRFDGSAANQLSGISVDSGHDVNGDGYNDVLSGAPNASIAGRGKVGITHLIFGDPSIDAMTTTNLGEIFLPHVAHFYGEQTNDRSGEVVAFAGDTDNDGYADILVASIDANRVYLYFGRVTYLQYYDFTNCVLPDCVSFDGPALAVRFGAAMAALGDINFDGFADFALCAPLTSPNSHDEGGTCFVILGRTRASWLQSNYVLGLGNTVPADLFGRIDGYANYLHFGLRVRAARKLDGDEIDDFFIDSMANTHFFRGKTHAEWASYSTSEWFFYLNLETWDSTLGISFLGFPGSKHASATLGDVYDTGRLSFAIGSDKKSSPNAIEAGALYVFNVTDELFTSSIFDLANFNATHGTLMYGHQAYGQFGHDVAPAGKIGPDEIDDFMVSANKVDDVPGDNTGMTLIISGNTSLPALIDFFYGFAPAFLRLTGGAAGDELGTSISYGGNVAGNNRSYFVLGAPYADGDSSLIKRYLNPLAGNTFVYRSAGPIILPPTLTPGPTAEPTAVPTPFPTTEPTAVPTPFPTPEPTANFTNAPFGTAPELIPITASGTRPTSPGINWALIMGISGGTGLFILLIFFSARKWKQYQDNKERENEQSEIIPPHVPDTLSRERSFSHTETRSRSHSRSRHGSARLSKRYSNEQDEHRKEYGSFFPGVSQYDVVGRAKSSPRAGYQVPTQRFGEDILSTAGYHFLPAGSLPAANKYDKFHTTKVSPPQSRSRTHSRGRTLPTNQPGYGDVSPEMAADVEAAAKAIAKKPSAAFKTPLNYGGVSPRMASEVNRAAKVAQQKHHYGDVTPEMASDVDSAAKMLQRKPAYGDVRGFQLSGINRDAAKANKGAHDNYDKVVFNANSEQRDYETASSPLQP